MEHFFKIDCQIHCSWWM